MSALYLPFGGPLDPEAIACNLHLLRASATRPVVLVGTPECFCRGLDLERAVAGEEVGADLFAALLHELYRREGPVIAQVEGEALGGGAGLASVADVVVASPKATFGLPEALLGLLPATILPYVLRRVGVAAARRLALTGETLDAAEARRLGLVDIVSDTPGRAVEQVLARLARMDPRSLAAIRALTADHFGTPASYTPAARASFGQLLTSVPTAARVRRWVDGAPPWMDDT